MGWEAPCISGAECPLASVACARDGDTLMCAHLIALDLGLMPADGIGSPMFLVGLASLCAGTKDSAELWRPSTSGSGQRPSPTAAARSRSSRGKT